MTNMPDAPLIYTLGVVRFPRVPDIGRFAGGFHDLIRSSHPLADDISAPLVSANFGPEGLRIEQHDTKLLQFASPDRKWAFLLTDEVLGLHTVDCIDHRDFVARFRTGLEALIQVPGIGIEWLEAVGIRYVDLVVPRRGEKLVEYLKSWVLPAEVPDIAGGMALRECIYVATYQTSVGELRFQALRNPPTTLPPELDTPLVQRNGWKHHVPDREFAVLDADHGCRFEMPVSMDIDMVCVRLLELRQTVKDLFLAAGTEHAVRTWRGES
jgi:uncharacterized protein (TIGR04255 family)